MKSVNLNGAWTLDIPGSFTGVNAIVPGTAYTDLARSGAIPEPYFRDNEDAILPIMENDFVFSREFEIDGEFLSHDLVCLEARGLDTLAEVTINGAHALSANNMHRTWEADVRELLKPGVNSISVRFASPTKFIREAYAKSPYEGSSDAMRGFPHIRKAHCMFGWDWGIRMPDVGIWRDISIKAFDVARIADFYVRQRHEDGRVFLDVEVTPDYITGADVTFKTTVTAPGGEVYTQTDADGAPIEIKNPEIWWPHGYGKQPLYKVEVSLFDESGRLLDSRTARIGLRTLTMHIEKDEWGSSFCARVNGVDIFSMGADYIPEDAMLGLATPARTRALLENAVAVNHNSIRVWGGGHYPSDAFFDICDELGLLVWQDFMFACASYELTDEFEENISAECRDNVIRLRNHASLALWCGNNEMEMFAAYGVWVHSPKQKSEYIRMYEHIIPKIVKKYDPDRFYWPASPSSTGSFDEPNDPNRGDTHYWEVWHGEKPFTAYRENFFRYASEFGFQAFPTLPTIEAFTEPEDRNPFSYVMEKHQRNAAANGKIMKYISQMYLYPRNFEMLVYTSQLLQGDAIRYGVEHWRRNRGRCMGAIVWQLNDNWPVISWSSIDYFGRWKALHYMEKRFFAPVLLSCEEQGELVGRTSVNEELKAPVDKSVRFNVSNETMSEVLCTVKWEIRGANSEILSGDSRDVRVPALSSVYLEKLALDDMNIRDEYVFYSLEIGGKTVSSGSALLVAPKHFRFEDPALAVWAEADEIVVHADAYAKGVYIQSEDPDLLLEDNWFDMNAGERRVKIVRGEAKEPSAVCVYDISEEC